MMDFFYIIAHQLSKIQFTYNASLSPKSAPESDAKSETREPQVQTQNPVQDTEPAGDLPFLLLHTA